MAENEIKSKAVKGVFWVGGEKLVRQLIQFGFGIMLARLLAPGDYGIVGMLAIFLTLASVIVDSGMASALIQQQDRTEEDYSTVFVFNLATSVLIYLILFFAAPAIASFYRTPILKQVTRAISTTIIINSLYTVNAARLSIQLRFKEQSIISLIASPVTCMVGVFFAFKGYGVWALVIQSIAGSVVSLILLVAFSRWFPKPGFSKSSFKKLFGFGSRILGTSILYTVYTNAYTLVIGRAFAPAQVGYYNRGNQYAMLPVQSFEDLAHKVNFPILAKVQDDNQMLLRAYKKMTNLPLYVLYPLLVGMAALAEPLIVTMIGEKWLPCVPIMQILCIGNMFGVLSDLNLNLLMVKGRSDLMLKLDLIKKPIAFAILFASIPFGIIWMVVFKSVYEVIAFCMNCHYTKRILDYGVIQQFKSVLPIFIQSFIMGAVVYFSTLFVSVMWVKIVVGFTVGVISYWLMSVCRKDENYFELLEIVKRYI